MKTAYKSKVVAKVRSVIDKRGLKQKAAAEKCSYSEKQFSNLLNGRKLITEQDIFNLCNGLEVSPNELFGFDENV